MTKTIDIRDLHTIYINLDDYKDRNEHMQQLLTDNGFKRFERLPAILAKPNMIEGQQGCAFSHCCAAKRLYRTCTDEYCLVLEDDIQFKDIDAINRAVNEILQTYPDIDCITITNHHIHKDKRGIYCPIPTPTRGTHFMFYRRKSLIKIANGLFNKWLQGTACDLWEFDEPMGIKSAVFYSDAVEQMKQSFISQNISNQFMSIYISENPLSGADFYELVYNGNINSRFDDCSLYKVYHIDDTDVTELFGDNTVKPVQLPEQLNALIKSESIMDRYKALIIYNHAIYPQFSVFRIWNREMNAWNAVSLK